MIFVTGQIAQDSKGNVVCEDIEGQTEYVFNCIEKILNKANACKEQINKINMVLNTSLRIRRT